MLWVDARRRPSEPGSDADEREPTMVVDDTGPEGRLDDAAAAELETALQVEAAERVDRDASQEVMSLLSEHVPLALLADLAIPEGPASPEILSEEGLPDVAWWEGAEHVEAQGGATAR